MVGTSSPAGLDAGPGPSCKVPLRLWKLVVLCSGSPAEHSQDYVPCLLQATSRVEPKGTACPLCHLTLENAPILTSPGHRRLPMYWMCCWVQLPCSSAALAMITLALFTPSCVTPRCWGTSAGSDAPFACVQADLTSAQGQLQAVHASNANLAAELRAVHAQASRARLTHVHPHLAAHDSPCAICAHRRAAAAPCRSLPDQLAHAAHSSTLHSGRHAAALRPGRSAVT